VLPIRFHDDKKGERALIRKTVAAFQELVGKNPEGWLSPHLSYTPNTLELLAEEGFRSFCDIVNDDQPYPIRAGGKTLIGIPNTGLGDIGLFAHQGKSPEEFVAAVKTCFDVLYEEGANQGRIMNINFHPYISGTPHNIRAIDRALEYVLRHKGVWNCTRSEIVDWYTDNHLPH